MTLEGYPFEPEDSLRMDDQSSARHSDVPQIGGSMRRAMDPDGQRPFQPPDRKNPIPILRPQPADSPPAPGEATDRPATPVAYTMPRAVPMTLDGSVTWQAAHLAQGTLYLPDTATDANAAEILLGGKVGELVATGFDIGPEGLGAKVYAAPGEDAHDAVIKVFRPRRSNNPFSPGDLPSLRLNVMMEKGLAEVDQTQAAWRIEGAKILGALVVYEDAFEGPSTRWLMQRIQPLVGVSTEDYMPPFNNYQTPTDSTAWMPMSSLPDVPERRELYQKALLGANGGQLAPEYRGESLEQNADFDDYPDNMIITQLPKMGRDGNIDSQGLAVKFDNIAWYGFDF